MEITNVRVRMVRNKPRLKAVASITLDNSLILNDIRIVQTKERLCVEFPRNPYASDANKIEYVVVPLSMEVRSMLENEIIGKYRTMISEYRREVV